MAKVLITGVCGFVGSHLACLLYEEGHEVIGVDLSTKTRNVKLNQLIEENKVKVVSGNLLEFDFSVIGDDIDYIYQIAGKVSVWGDINEFNKINVDGTKKILDYAKQIQAKCVVYLSSTAVYGYYNYTDLKEEDEKRPMNNPYPLSKLKAETMVMEYCNQIKQNYVIVRPGNVYGEYDMTSSYDIYRMIQKQKMPVIDKGKYKSCFVYVKNLVKGIYQASITPEAYNEDYNLTDGYGETLKEYFTYVAQALEVKPKFTSVPSFLSKILATTVETFYRIFKIKTMPLITMFSVLQNSGHYHFSIEKAQKAFNYSPKFTLEQGTKNTAEWFKTQPNNIKVKR